MPKFVVIGYGNPLRSDDGFGWKVAAELRNRKLAEDVEITTCQQLGPELVEVISNCRLVIFVDASVNGDNGAVTIRRLEPSAAASNQTHHFKPAALLSWAESLHRRAPEAMLVTAVGQCFALGDELSSTVANAVPIAVAGIRSILSTAG